MFRSSENWGPGRGRGHRFSDRDVEALEVYRELRWEQWSRKEAAWAAEEFRISDVPVEELRILVINGVYSVARSSDPLPDRLSELADVRITNLGPRFQRLRRRAA